MGHNACHKPGAETRPEELQVLNTMENYSAKEARHLFWGFKANYFTPCDWSLMLINTAKSKFWWSLICLSGWLATFSAWCQLSTKVRTCKSKAAVFVPFSHRPTSCLHGNTARWDQCIHDLISRLCWNSNSTSVWTLSYRRVTDVREPPGETLSANAVKKIPTPTAQILRRLSSLPSARDCQIFTGFCWINGRKDDSGRLTEITTQCRRGVSLQASAENTTLRKGLSTVQQATVWKHPVFPSIRFRNWWRRHILAARAARRNAANWMAQKAAAGLRWAIWSRSWEKWSANILSGHNMCVLWPAGKSV